MRRLKLALQRALPKNEFARSIGVLVGGTAGAQLILVLTSPLLTRLYSPSDFGLLAVYASLLAMISVIASLRYELAIPLPESNRDGASVAALSLLIVIITSALTALMTTLFSDQIAHSLKMPALANYLWLLPIGVLLSGFYTVFTYWSIRTKRFDTIAGTRVHQSLATITIQLFAFKLGGIALLFGQTFGQGVGLSNLMRPAVILPEFKTANWQDLSTVAKRYRRFPLFSTWEGLSNTAGSQLPTLLFGVLFSPAAAGLYTLANRVLNLPMALVGQAVGHVFLANAAEAFRTGKIAPLVQTLHSKLALVGFPPVLLLMLLGPELFTNIFGVEWQRAGEFSRWMAPWLYLVFITSPLSTLFSVAEKQMHGLAFQLILLLARVTAIAIGGFVNDLDLTIVLFSSASALCWFGFLFWVADTAGIAPGSMITPTLRAAVVGFFCTLPIAATKTIPGLAGFWPYALLLSLLMIFGHYWRLIRKSF